MSLTFSNPKNIFYQCIDNSDVFHECGKQKLISKLEEKKHQYENQGYKVVFTDDCSSVISGARAVLYDKNQQIPSQMQDYRQKWVKTKYGEWIRQGLLGVCDCCGVYAELTCLCDKGHICNNCDFED